MSEVMGDFSTIATYCVSKSNTVEKVAPMFKNA